MVVRRDMLQGLVFASLLAGSPAWARHQGKGGAKPLGLQLFTVLKLLEGDFEGTLKLVASLGYRKVETLGSFGRDPRRVRASFARHGLVSPSQHMMPGNLYGYFQKPPITPADKLAMSANFDQAFAPENVDHFVREAIGRAKLLGQKYVVWQLAWRPRYDLKDAERYARAFNRAGALCADAGLGFAYHNHDTEFEPIGGVRPFDILVGHTDPKLVKIEIDFMWATKGGADPIALMRDNPGRFRLCHLKDRSAAGEIVTVGEGVEDFPTLIAAAKQAGIEHYYLEFDRPGNPDHEIRRAATFLKPLLAKR